MRSGTEKLAPDMSWDFASVAIGGGIGALVGFAIGGPALVIGIVVGIALGLVVALTRVGFRRRDRRRAAVDAADFSTATVASSAAFPSHSPVDNLSAGSS